MVTARTVFAGGLLLAACWFTVDAFRYDFMVAGRPGPGFFPRLVGLGLVGACLYVLVAEAGRPRPSDAGPVSHSAATLGFALGGGLFVMAFAWLGAWPAIFLYLLITLSVLNRGRHGWNIGISTAVPILFFLLFDVWLNAPLPEGFIRLVP